MINGARSYIRVRPNVHFLFLHFHFFRFFLLIATWHAWARVADEVPDDDETDESGRLQDNNGPHVFWRMFNGNEAKEDEGVRDDPNQVRECNSFAEHVILLRQQLCLRFFSRYATNDDVKFCQNVINVIERHQGQGRHEHLES